MYAQGNQEQDQLKVSRDAINKCCSNSRLQSKEPILTYYYIRGLCQPIRNLLYYLQVPFEDRRLDRNSIDTLQLDKLESTFNSGLPSFQDKESGLDGSVSISDSIAIAIYICKRYNSMGLLGENIQKRAKVNEVLFKYWMEKKKIMPEIT